MASGDYPPKTATPMATPCAHALPARHKAIRVHTAPQMLRWKINVWGISILVSLRSPHISIPIRDFDILSSRVVCKPLLENWKKEKKTNSASTSKSQGRPTEARSGHRNNSILVKFQPSTRSSSKTSNRRSKAPGCTFCLKISGQKRNQVPLVFSLKWIVSFRLLMTSWAPEFWDKPTLLNVPFMLQCQHLHPAFRRGAIAFPDSAQNSKKSEPKQQCQKPAVHGMQGALAVVFHCFTAHLF